LRLNRCALPSTVCFSLALSASRFPSCSRRKAARARDGESFVVEQPLDGERPCPRLPVGRSRCPLELLTGSSMGNSVFPVTQHEKALDPPVRLTRRCGRVFSPWRLARLCRLFGIGSPAGGRRYRSSCASLM